MAKRLSIVNGPSKWDIILALFDTTEDLDPSRVRQNGRLVILEIADEEGKNWKGEIHIDAVKKNQDFGFQDSDWKLEGHYVFPRLSPLGEKFIVWRPFIALFNTQTRKGWLEPVKES
ncbi:MAG: hypothetical protein PHQ47_00285 [Candidatus Portnoybacteria bacterium]|nr:hypothetical protein [Candidatus Portnoybacteria bacterium]